MKRCRCGSYDLDLSTDPDYDLECYECGRKYKNRKSQSKREKRAVKRMKEE